VLLAARRSAINASTEAQLQVFSLVIAAPEPIRARFRGQKLAAMLNTAASLRLHPSWDVETTSTVVALRTLARRAHAMLKEARELQKAIVAIIRSWRPDLLEEFGVGPIVAATVLCAWSHPGRVHSEAAFAMLAGVAPIPANSGQVTTRYRLNRYGDRQLNNALHTVVQSRIQYQPATRDYVARRTADGKTSREIKRCLARYVARDLYRLLENGAAAA
jgi:transposase